MKKIFLASVGLALLMLAGCQRMEAVDAIKKGDLQKIKSIVRDSPGLIDATCDSCLYENMLLLATAKGDAELAGMLMDNGFDMKLCGEVDPVIMAIKMKRPEVARVLVEKGAALFTPSPETDDCSALFFAAEKGYDKIVSAMIERGAPLEIGCGPETPLMAAARRGHRKTYDLLTQKGAGRTVKPAGGSSWLHYHAAGGFVDLVEKDLAQGADPLARDGLGRDPYFLATLHGRIKARNTIIQAVPMLERERYQGKGCVETADLQGLILLHAAAAGGVESQVNQCLDSGINPNQPIAPVNGLSYPVEFAISRCRAETVKTLFQRGAALDLEKPIELSPEHGDSCVEMISLLLEKGAKTTEAVGGVTSLFNEAYYTEDFGPRIIELLLEAGADPNARELVDGERPLHWAARWSGNKKIVDLLLKAGADPRAHTNNGETAIDFALIWQNKNLADYLREKK